MAASFKTEMVLVGRLARAEDILAGLTAVALERGIRAAVVQGVGATREAVLGFYDQEALEYRDHSIPEPMELLSLTGNISLKDGSPFVHVHAILSDEQGRAFGGHVMPGTRVFALEYSLMVLDGPELCREYDRETHLYLWPASVSRALG
ncbi:MAG: DNA-binding protein [Deltaproteobacteria bacterium]|nr:DNA-binding protein [Deltaproteobacteria bacterium]